jgi:hypothetical protein
MATPVTFGVTLDIVRQYAPGLPATLSTTTYPTETGLTAIINRKASAWTERLRQTSIDAASIAVDPASTSYLIMQEVIAIDVVLVILISRERIATEMITELKEQRDAAWLRIVEEPATVGVDLSQASWVLDSHVTQQAQIERDVQGQSLGVRLASAGRL